MGATEPKSTVDSDSLGRFVAASTRLNLLFAIQVIAGLAFAYATGEAGQRITHFLLPFIWSTASVWVVWHTRPDSPRPRVRILAAAVAAAYLLVLFYLSGLLQSSSPSIGQLIGSNAIGVTWGRSLGWSPVLVYVGDWVALTLVPYQTLGLVALAYLVYDALLEVARSAIGGVIGFAACPACVGPMFAPLLAGGASSSSVVLVAGRWGYEIATVLFLVSISILYHRRHLQRLYATVRN
ncbi:DUF7546 family protein [Natronorubrum aibiense]|uniref:Uncharacterized protein n=1 Tax=Natronorubrum aibiense TaxID=348826 RepID=A0A5P9P876_9EURY|nr:hypothetical protein [Natronorubrum aibiense]QFU84333.1 hypothetical protein GCU68_17355 [Natronorubrum aibiense]